MTAIGAKLSWAFPWGISHLAAWLELEDKMASFTSGTFTLAIGYAALPKVVENTTTGQRQKLQSNLWPNSRIHVTPSLPHSIGQSKEQDKAIFKAGDIDSTSWQKKVQNVATFFNQQETA